MRISDWSSDVCSSDLGRELVGGVPVLALHVLREADGAGGSIGHPQARPFVVGRDALLLRQQLQGGQAAVACNTLVRLAICGWADEQVLQQAIGRGWCREGVYPYVKIMVVDISI